MQPKSLYAAIGLYIAAAAVALLEHERFIAIVTLAIMFAVIWEWRRLTHERGAKVRADVVGGDTKAQD